MTRTGNYLPFCSRPISPLTELVNWLWHTCCAVTVFALLELYKRGEAWWEQDESFGEIAVHAVAAAVPEPLQARAV